MNEILKALKCLFYKNKVNKIILLCIFSFFLVFLVYLPVFLIPGNDIFFQLKLYKLLDWLVMVLMSLGLGIMFFLQINIFRRILVSKKEKYKTTVLSEISGYFSVIGTSLITATCPSCIAGILGFMGMGSILFLLKYKWLFFLLSLFIIYTSIYFLSRKYNNNCKSCRI